MCTNYNEKNKKRPAAGVICAILCLIMVLSSASVSGAATYSYGLNYLYKDIYVDGCHINNYQLENPVCILNGSAYIPLDDEFQNLLGLSLKVGEGIVQFRLSEPVPYQAPSDLCFVKNHFDDRIGVTFYEDTKTYLCAEFADPHVFTEEAEKARKSNAIGKLALVAASAAEAGDLASLTLTGDLAEMTEDTVPGASLPGVPLTIKGSDMYIAGSIIYIRVGALASDPDLPYSVYFDSIGGLAISTKAAESAQYQFSNNNRSYIQGRAAYMKSVQKKLSDNDALILEYLFRHEATVNGIEEDLCIALCQTESTFDLNLPYREGKAIGLMQLMPKTVKGAGWTIEQVRDKYGNIEFGVNYLAQKLKRYNGNQVLALSAYNQGSGKVASGNYSTVYASKVLSHKNAMINWTKKNGYAQSFLEVSERIGN